MVYFSETSDASLAEWIAEIMAVVYYKQVEVSHINVSPYGAYNVKAEKVLSQACKPKDIGDTTVKQMASYASIVIAGAGYSSGEEVTIIKRVTPDADIISKIMHLFLYLDLGDSTNAYAMIKDISEETKNVINENLMQIRRQPVSESELTPWQL